MGAPGELFRAHPHAKPSRANFFAHKTQQNGNTETNNTSATEKRAKNTRFSPAKATPVSTSHGHKLAKATGVSKNRTAWSTGPGRGAHGLQPGRASRRRAERSSRRGRLAGGQATRRLEIRRSEATPEIRRRRPRAHTAARPSGQPGPTAPETPAAPQATPPNGKPTAPGMP